MPKKQKQGQRNGFSYFLMHIRDNYRPKPRSMQQAQEIAGRFWHNMDAKQREPWEKQASKNRANQVKLTTYGVPIKQQEAREQEQIDKQKQINKDIEQLVKSLSSDPQGSLSEYVFHFLHINAYVRTDSGEIVPAEIGLSEFSLRRGITKTYSTFVNVCPIPLGYCHIAKEIASKTHKLPLPGEKKTMKLLETNAEKIMSDIRNFCFGTNEVFECSGRPLPTFYCCVDDIDSVRECLEKLIDLSGQMIPANVHPLDHLLFHLSKFTASLKGEQGIPTLALAIGEVDKDVHMYAPEIACEYHEEEDATKYCSLSKVHRWGYLIADFCCKDLDIDLIPFQHCQKNAKLSHYCDAKYSSDDDIDTSVFSPAPSPALSSTSSSKRSSSSSNQKDWSTHSFSGIGRGRGLMSRGNYPSSNVCDNRPGSSSSSSSFEKPLLRVPRPQYYDDDDEDTTEQVQQMGWNIVTKKNRSPHSQNAVDQVSKELGMFRLSDSARNSDDVNQ